jgi:hypothetical protein
MLDWDEGYGWEKWETKDQPRFKETIYFMSGQAPGFASKIIYLPRLLGEIIILSNFQIPVPTTIGYDLAAMLEGGEYHPLELRNSPLTAEEISRVIGSFTFGPDFYRSNATLQLVSGPDGLVLRWPGGPDSPVLVIDDHHFIDRHYWSRFTVADDENGHASQLTFVKFIGRRSPDTPTPAH